MSSWSAVLIPDTQHLATPANGWTAIYNGLRDWIVANVDTYNVQLVAHLGDIVHNPTSNGSWLNAQTALSPLFDLDIPVLLLACGNHDYHLDDPEARTTTEFNNFFGIDNYSGKPWFGGTYETGKAENLWITFDVAGRHYLALALEFWPRSGALDWAKGVIAAHPDHEVIITTHAFMYQDGTRTQWGDDFDPGNYGFTQGNGGANDGEEMWAGWLSECPNLRCVFNGHHIGPPYLSYKTDQISGAYGKTLQAFYNWQQVGSGGDGRIVLVTFDYTARTIRHQVVRTDTATFEAGTNYDVTHSAMWPPLPVMRAQGARVAAVML